MLVAMLLFYTPGTCALGCIAWLRFTKLGFSLCHVTRDERFGPVYRRVNPRSQVPAMAVEGRVLTENAAILLHIAARAGAEHLPADGTTARDDLNFWLSWLDSGFHVAFYPFFKPQRYLPDEARHPDLREAAKPVIRDAYDTLERHLSKHDFMQDAYGLLDPYVFAMTRWGMTVFGSIEDWPAVQAHRERMLEREELRFALAVEAGEQRAADGPYLGHVDLATAAAKL